MPDKPTDDEIDALWRFEASKNWDSALAMRTSFTHAALAKWGQPAHSGEPVHANTEKTVERYLNIFKDNTTGQYYAAPFMHEELTKSSKYARDMSEYQINKTCVARLKLAFVEGRFDDV